MASTRESGISQMHSPRFATRTTRRLGEGTKNVLARLASKRRRRTSNDDAFVNLSVVLTIVGSLLIGIIAAPIALNLLAGQMPTIVGSVFNITTAFKDADWGDDNANALSPTMGMLVALTGVFSVAALAFGVWYINRRQSRAG